MHSRGDDRDRVHARRARPSAAEQRVTVRPRCLACAPTRLCAESRSSLHPTVLCTLQPRISPAAAHFGTPPASAHHRPAPPWHWLPQARRDLSLVGRRHLGPGRPSQAGRHQKMTPASRTHLIVYMGLCCTTIYFMIHYAVIASSSTGSDLTLGGAADVGATRALRSSGNVAASSASSCAHRVCGRNKEVGGCKQEVGGSDGVSAARHPRQSGQPAVIPNIPSWPQSFQACFRCGPPCAPGCPACTAPGSCSRQHT